MSGRTPCLCTGRSGARKRLFRNRRAAVTEALRRGWAPSTYPCPSGRGVHLTHGGRS